jgi:DNA primase
MEVIDQIRQAANILDIASQYTTLRKSGKRYLGLCPFHSEKTPSFTLDEEKQLFHCFGCGAGGDIFTFVMEKENLSFAESLRYLAQKYNIPLPERKRLSPQYKKLEENISKLTESALAFFKKNLFNTSEGRKALEYLKKRQISDEILQKFKIGYALNSWDSLISFFQRQKVSHKLLEKAGLVIYNPKKESYYDRFRGRVIFPIFSESGKIVAFGGRTLFDAEPKYLNSPDTPIYKKGGLLYGLNFCKEKIREKREIILVEGYTDFISLFQAGIRNLAASLGTSLTSEQISKARNFARKKMIVCFDADTAGIKAAARAVSLGFEEGMQTYVLKLPQGNDPDTFIKKFGVDAFNRLAEKSTPGLKFLIQIQEKDFNSDIPEEKAQIANNIASELEKISDLMVRDEYVKQTCEYLNVDEAELRSRIKQKKNVPMVKGKISLLPVEEILLLILFKHKTIAQSLLGSLNLEYLKGLRSQPIFKIAQMRYAKNKRLPEISDIKMELDRSLYSSLSEILIESDYTPSKDEVKDCLEIIKQRYLENKRKELRVQIDRLERSKEEENKITLLLKQISEITNQLSAMPQRNQ